MSDTCGVRHPFAGRRRGVLRTGRARAGRHRPGRRSRAGARGRRGDHPVGEQLPVDPVDHLAPVVRVEEDDREVTDLAGLDQRQRLVHLVERPEAAGEDDEPLGRADEAHLARVEVVERVLDVEVRVRALLVRQLDVEPDREAAALLRAAVRALHHAAAAAGDHRPAVLAEPPADRAGVLVGLASLRRRAPSRTSRPPGAGPRPPSRSPRGTPR